MKKKVLLLALIDYGLYESIKENLEYNGFSVTLVLNAGYPFKYRSLGERLHNLLRKVFWRDYAHKERLKEKYIQERQLQIINEEKCYDYCLVIRSDFFSLNTLRAAKAKSKLFVSYHYDGLERNNSVFERTGLFDRFFVFDERDIKKFPQYNLELTSNFYFDCYPTHELPRLSKKKVFFLGTHHPSRVTSLLRCYDTLLRNDLKVDFEVVINPLKPSPSALYQGKDITLLNEIIPYKIYLEKVASTDIILDLLISEHQGLSFRIFEALYYRKKIITTNEKVKEMDFYHSSNFFIVRNDDFIGLSAFLETPYVDIDRTIVDKYSFSSWIKNIFNIVS